MNIDLPKDVWEDFSRYCGQHGMEPVHGLTQLLQEVLEQPFSSVDNGEAHSGVSNDIIQQDDIVRSQGGGTDIFGASEDGGQPWEREKDKVPFSTKGNNLNALNSNGDGVQDSLAQSFSREESPALSLNDPGPNSFGPGNEVIFPGKEGEINSAGDMSTQSSLVEKEHQPSAEEILQEIVEEDIEDGSSGGEFGKPILEESSDHSLSDAAGISPEGSLDPISPYKEKQSEGESPVLVPYFDEREKQAESGIEEIPEHIRQKVAVVAPLTQGNLQSSNPKMIDPFGKVPTIEQLMLKKRR
ncbi:hypothetical protein HYV84_06970 [Candidatus Woesearchaeota archaeon]|nr:hypothetical protein [Candidatus Woesearchaeota archaeon]